MNIFKRIIGDTLLIGVLFSLLFLPFGTVGLSGVNESAVLSESDVYEEATPTEYTNSEQVYQNQKVYPFENPNYLEEAEREIREARQSSPSEGQEVNYSQN